jgi:putative oxidoreductase
VLGRYRYSLKKIGDTAVEENPQRDLFDPILSSDALMGPFLLIARLLTTGIFIYYIYGEIVRIHEPGMFIYLTIAAQFVGIVLVALGYKTRFAALLLAACILASLLFRGGLGFNNYLVTISEKDIAIAGCFLFLFAYGPGMLSIDAILGGGEARRISAMPESNALIGPLLLAGRMMSVLVFLYFGISKILHTAEVEAFMTRHNPHVPLNLVYLAIVTQIIPPLMVLFGYKTRYGALILAGFCIIAPALFHADFANRSEVEHFLLDFATTGGFLFMFAYGPGPLSVDTWLARSRQSATKKEALSLGA